MAETTQGRDIDRQLDSIAPLAGIKVLDLGTFIAAPFCSTLLAEFGADVIKIERPGVGDSLRTLGEEKGGVPLLWLQEARNKRSITCELSHPLGQQVIRDLVAQGYDILVENFRPGTLESWGLGYEVLAAISRKVILARVTGYGQYGPLRRDPAFGRTAQAFAGLTYLSGFPESPPVNPGSATIADYVSGLFAAVGVLIAHNSRLESGSGQEIDVSLFESVFRIMDSLAVSYSANGTVRERMGTATALAAPHNHYQTGDEKWIAIACTNDAIFGRLAGAMGRPTLTRDARFETARARVAHREAIDAIVGHWTAERTSGEAIAQLRAAEVPCSPINSIADIFADPQFAARDAIARFEHAVIGSVAMPNIVPRLSKAPGRIRHLGPDLGSDTEDVLKTVLRYDAARINALRSNRAC